MEKYEETIAALHNRKLDVFSFDWQGQGLSDRILPDREKGFVRHYDDYLEDLDRMLEVVVRPGLRGELFLLAHSMGGHIGLQYLYRDEHIFSKAVFCAPMIDIVTHPFPSFFARWLSRRQVAAGNAHKVVVGADQRTPFPERFENNVWTSDRKRFDRVRKGIKEHPELSAAMVTYGWVAATYDSIDVLKRIGREPSRNTPFLFAAAGRDCVVSNKAIRKFVSTAGNCRLVVIKDARHEILQEADYQRGLFWQAFDEFMRL
jgi:lysophospholipase